MLDYRRRIYQQYQEAGANAPRADKLAEFQGRSAYLEKLLRDYFPEDSEAAILDQGCSVGSLEGNEICSQNLLGLAVK